MTSSSRMSPFVVFSLPRSRSFWLSRFLTSGSWACGHDEIVRFRGLEDVVSWLDQDYVGSVETAGASFWRLLAKYRPDTRVAVVLRPRAEVVRSLSSFVLPFDLSRLDRDLFLLESKLHQIIRRLPNVMAVHFHDLEREDVCKSLYEFCLQEPLPVGRWEQFSSLNLQRSLVHSLLYCQANHVQIERLRGIAKQRVFADLAARLPSVASGLVIRAEPFGEFYEAATALFRQHAMETGEHPDYAYLNKNISMFFYLESIGNLRMVVARQNGVVRGYLMTLESVSLENPNERIGYHALRFASGEFPGLGLKLHRAALADSRSRGLSDVFSRAGARGSGPRIASIFRRCGAALDGEMYRLSLRET